MKPDAIELRVLGCLIEKQRTTPDQYPLTLNSLRLACNQSTNRDPVMDLEESVIVAALRRLNDKHWAQLATWTERRTKKYRQLFGKQEELSDGEETLMCLLMLRGPQTPAELRARSERMHRFETDELELALESLAERDFARELARQPGQRGARWDQTIQADQEPPPPEPPKPFVSSARTAEPPMQLDPASQSPPLAPGGPQSAPEGAPQSSTGEPQPLAVGGDLSARADASLDERVGRLEREVAALKQTITMLRRELGGS